MVVLLPLGFQSSFLAFKLDLVFGFLAKLLGFLHPSLLGIGHLGLGVELRKEVRVVGGITLDLTDKVLLVEAEFKIPKLMILGVLIRVLLGLDYLPPLINNVHVLLTEVHFSVQYRRHVELSDEAFPLLHDMPGVGLGILESDSASEHQTGAVLALEVKQTLLPDSLTHNFVMEVIIEKQLRVILKGLFT